MKPDTFHTAGYIGGSVLQQILQHPDASTFDITVLVRDASKAKFLETKFGVKTVVGSMEDLESLSLLAENAHVVVQCVRLRAHSERGHMHCLALTFFPICSGGFRPRRADECYPCRA